MERGSNTNFCSNQPVREMEKNLFVSSSILQPFLDMGQSVRQTDKQPDTKIDTAK